MSKTLRRGQSATRLRAREREVLELWDEGVEQITEKLRMARPVVRPCPDQKFESIIKIEAYRLAKRLYDRRFRANFETVLIYKMEGATPRSSFEANPFYWALKAIQIDGIEIKPSVISRYAKQLLYADRHEIPPELLTGFIYQVGGIRKISSNLNKNKVEPWYQADLPWATLR